jgi:hypothetical protein
MLVVRTRILAGVPRTAGTPNCSAASMKTSSAPPSIAGSTSGSVTRQVVFHMPAPEDSDASSSVGSIDRSAPATMRNTKGIS